MASIIIPCEFMITYSVSVMLQLMMHYHFFSDALSPVLPETDEPLIRVSNITKTSFVLEWDPILNAVSYVIVVRASSIITDEELVR